MEIQEVMNATMQDAIKKIEEKYDGKVVEVIGEGQTVLPDPFSEFIWNKTAAGAYTFKGTDGNLHVCLVPFGTFVAMAAAVDVVRRHNSEVGGKFSSDRPPLNSPKIPETEPRIPRKKAILSIR